MANQFSITERAVVGELYAVALVCGGSTEAPVRAFAVLVRERIRAIVEDGADIILCDDDAMHFVAMPPTTVQ